MLSKGIIILFSKISNNTMYTRVDHSGYTNIQMWSSLGDI